jgi:hypothetical protein
MKRSGVIALLLLAGCGKTRQPANSETKPQPEYYKVDPATSASLRGRVIFEGKRPPPKKISMDAEEACQKLHKTAVFDEQILTAKDGGLANAFVYVKTGFEGKHFPPPDQAVLLDQRGCQFMPRVIAIRAGQTLQVRNSDPVSHNIHPMPKNNRDWNQQQPPESADLQRRFVRPEVMIPVKCNVHNWMRSYIGVMEHPYFAVTGKDGEFEIKDLPPGEYTIAAWHESLGEATQTISLQQKQAAETKFVFR